MPDEVMGLPDTLNRVGTVIATLVTVPLVAGAVDDQVVPLDVNTLPEVLGATNKGVEVPLPKMTLFAVRVVRLVPPLATGNVPVTFVARFTNVVDVVPVPPDATGRAAPRVKAAK